MLGVEIDIVQAQVEFILPLLKEIDGFIDRYPIQPGVKTGSALERFQR